MKFIAALVFSSILSIAYSELVCSGEHEYLVHLTPACLLSCQSYGKPLCFGLIEKDSCQCSEGTIRDTVSGKCVKHEDCPKPEFFEELLCDGEHEHLSHQTPVCPMTCQSLGRAHCMSIMMKDSCQCSEGTIRDTVSGKCVKHEECPNHEFFEELLCDGENEHLSQTTPGCPSTCQNRHLLFKCLVIINKPSCQCNAGTIRDTALNKCVAVDQCSQ